ncbi:MAG TPA: SDR family NAD(P)-dependent oxidoreductase [Candidatus Dormibacteraeota bacterium]
MAEWTGVGGKQVVITGATNGIGLAAAEALGARGARLAIVARSEDRARAAVGRIRSAAGSGVTVEVFSADLSSQHSVRRLAAELRERLPRIDVLVNNAGAIFHRWQLTEDGAEQTWALNHLAPFLLTNLLLDRLKESAPARIVTTSSRAHHGASAPFDDLDGRRSFSRGAPAARGFPRYGESKLANILFTTELARRLEGTGVTANCFHPGFVASGFNLNNGPGMRLAMTLARPFARSPQRGAETLVWLVDSPEVSGQSGGYYVDKRRRTPSPSARDQEAARRLWEVSEEQTSTSAVG